MLDLLTERQGVWGPGRYRVAVVTVQFPDAVEVLPAGWGSRTIAEADAYFREASGGAVRWAAADEEALIVRLRRPATWWRLQRRSLNDRVRFWKRITARLSPAADALLVVVPSRVPLRGCFAIGPRWHSPRLGQALQGLGEQFYRGAVVKPDTPWGTIVHELGHVLWLPDLYDYEDGRAFPRTPARASRYVGPWDLMSRVPAGAGGRPLPMAWTRALAGWVDPVPWTVEQERYGLGAGAAGPVVRAPLRPGVSMFVEARHRIGFDSSLSAEGVLISIADDAIAEGRGPLRLLSPSRGTPSRRRRGGLMPLAEAAFQVGEAVEVEGYRVHVVARLPHGFEVAITR